MARRLEDIKSNHYNLIYLTPEKILCDEVLKVIEHLNNKIQIARFVFDEIHTVANWTDFRADFMRLGDLRENFPDVPILGLTATANHKLIEKIKTSLGLSQNTLVF